MTDSSKSQDQTLDDDDLGEPIGLLADFREAAPRQLRGRIRNAIQRRHLAADVTGFSVLVPLAVFLEYVTALFRAVVGPGSTDKDDDL